MERALGGGAAVCAHGAQRGRARAAGARATGRPGGAALRQGRRAGGRGVRVAWWEGAVVTSGRAGGVARARPRTRGERATRPQARVDQRGRRRRQRAGWGIRRPLYTLRIRYYGNAPPRGRPAGPSRGA
eukprot:587738-Prymnesium_polylepis.1